LRRSEEPRDFHPALRTENSYGKTPQWRNGMENCSSGYHATIDEDLCDQPAQRVSDSEGFSGRFLAMSHTDLPAQQGSVLPGQYHSAACREVLWAVRLVWPGWCNGFVAFAFKIILPVFPSEVTLQKLR